MIFIRNFLAEHGKNLGEFDSDDIMLSLAQLGFQFDPMDSKLKREISRGLSRLCKRGEIRRIRRGIYIV